MQNFSSFGLLHLAGSKDLAEDFGGGGEVQLCVEQMLKNKGWHSSKAWSQFSASCGLVKLQEPTPGVTIPAGRGSAMDWALASFCCLQMYTQQDVKCPLKFL